VPLRNYLLTRSLACESNRGSHYGLRHGRVKFCVSGSLKDGETHKTPVALFKRPVGCAGKELFCFEVKK